MNGLQIEVCRMIAQSMFVGVNNNALPQETDWQAVFNEMKSQAVEGLAGSLIKDLKLPDHIRKIWKQHIINHLVRYIQVTNAQEIFCQLMKHNNVRFVVVKGLSASKYYPVAQYRTLGDIDVIVHPNDFKTAQSVVELNGFIQICDNGRHIEYKKNNAIFEMHRYFDGEQENPIDEIILEGMNKVEWYRLERTTFPCLPDPINGLVILQHIRQHFVKNSGLGLRQIVDWMMFVHYYLDDEHWKTFRRLTDKTGLTKLALAVTRMCQLFLGLEESIAWCHDVDTSVCTDILELIFESGNMGNKLNKNETAVSTVLRRLRSEGIFQKLRKTGELKWDTLKRYPWLTFLAWIYGLYFYVKRGFEVGGISNAIIGYKKAKHFEKLLKRIDLN